MFGYPDYCWDSSSIQDDARFGHGPGSRNEPSGTFPNNVRRFRTRCPNLREQETSEQFSPAGPVCVFDVSRPLSFCPAGPVFSTQHPQSGAKIWFPCFRNDNFTVQTTDFRPTPALRHEGYMPGNQLDFRLKSRIPRVESGIFG